MDVVLKTESGTVRGDLISVIDGKNIVFLLWNGI